MKPPSNIDDFRHGRPSKGKCRLLRTTDVIVREILPAIPRPRRSECRGGPRPCPLVGCPYNNYLAVDSRGNIKIAHGSREPEDVPPSESCCLDVAERGPHTLEEVADILGLTRERVRQLEVHLIAKMRREMARQDKNDEDLDRLMSELARRAAKT